MALPPLATATDLATYHIDTADAGLITQLLGAASATIRGAAGSPILETTSTVTLTGRWDDEYLRLPGAPIQSVGTVELAGTPISDWRLDGDRLWRLSRWGVDYGPNEVVVTLTHGLPEVPADIVDLASALVGAGLAAAGEGYESHAGVVAERIDDYSVTYAQGAEAVATAMELPARTRTALRARFGNSAGMGTHR